MSKSLTITNKNNSFVRLQTRDYSYHPATVNGIQRMMLNYQKSYAFNMYLDIDDYDFLGEDLKIPRVNKMHQKFITLSCNTKYPIPMLSLHMSRQAINSSVFDAEGQNLLLQSDTRKVYFAVCASKQDEADPMKRISTPLINKTSVPRFIYARELTPFVFTRISQTDEWGFDLKQTTLLEDNIDSIFFYNGKVALLEHGKFINALLKPSLITGKEDPAGSPCRSSYRWTMNPVFKDSFPIVNSDFTLRRKVEGEPSAKDMFLMVPTTEEDTYGKMSYQNKFGKPYGLDLMFQYNGKHDPLLSMIEAVKIFKINLNLMKEQFLNDDSVIIHKENSDYSTKLTIPLNVDVDLMKHEGGKYKVLLDDGMLHAVSVKILEILDSVILENIKLWEHVSVYYKVPHRLIPQSELMCKLPESDEFNKILKVKLIELQVNSGMNNTHSLIQCAINQVVADLDMIQHVLTLNL